MEKRVPKKNIEPVLVDVKKPDFNYKNSAKFADLNLAKETLERKGSKSFNVFKTSGIILASFFLLFLGLAALDFNQTKNLVSDKSDSLVNNTINSLNSIREFKPGGAGEALKANNQDLLAINQSLDKGPSGLFMGLLSQVSPFFKDVSGTLKGFTEVNVGLLSLSNNLENLQLNAFSYFRNDGNELLSRMKEIKETVAQLQVKIEDLRNKSKSISNFSYFENFNSSIEDSYINYGSDLYLLDDLLSGLISLLEKEGESRILLMFQNSSEIRPAGGFMGSYGELVIEDGQMKDLIVQDTYWPDHEINLDEKLVPPKPLQHVTTNWGARDANWFFDFPTSAENAMRILEMSNIYEDEGKTFEAAIGINVNVLGSLLEIIGPVEAEDYDLVIDESNFLQELQREIEVGRDAVPGENPKKILSIITPKIMERLENLNENESRELLEFIKDHFENKDIMAYSRDSKIARALNRFSIDGSVYQVPSSFWGSYLAIVNSNIAGGKTDAFIDQEIDLKIEVSSDGSFIGDLIITRSHNGLDQEDSWYTTENKNYIKIFTNNNSSPLLVEGNQIRQRVDNTYPSSYLYLDPLRKIEETERLLDSFNVWRTEEFGKYVYGTWFNIQAGKTDDLNFRYSVPYEKNNDLKEGDKFRLVLEKQSGVESDINLRVGAPIGFRWEESNSPLFTYQGSLGKREIIDLTLSR